MITRRPWAAQNRLCGRFLHLLRLGKPKQKAIARDLLGFIWAIARELDDRTHGKGTA